MRKASCYFFLFLSLSGCAPPPEKDGAPENATLPTTCTGAIEAVAAKLDDDSRKTLRQTEKEDLVMFHLSWGMGIRNAYGLWDENSQIRKSCATQAGEEDVHPDSASGIIMVGVWELVNGSM